MGGILRQLLKFQQLAQYVRQHALNHFEQTEWEMIDDLYQRKLLAVQEIHHFTPVYMQRLHLMAQVFDRYRLGLFHMEKTKQGLMNTFDQSLKTTLKFSKQIREGEFNEKHVQAILTAVHNFDSEYKQAYSYIRDHLYHLAQ